MNIIAKRIKSWWVILSIIPVINGFGIIHIGLKHNNPNWVLEGITYEVPWFFCILILAIYGSFSIQFILMLSITLIILLVGIIRSIWIAVKLVDIYDNEEKYTFKQTQLKDTRAKTNKSSRNINDKSKNNNIKGCCFCILLIFIIFAVITIIRL